MDRFEKIGYVSVIIIVLSVYWLLASTVSVDVRNAIERDKIVENPVNVDIYDLSFDSEGVSLGEMKKKETSIVLIFERSDGNGMSKAKIVFDTDLNIDLVNVTGRTGALQVPKPLSIIFRIFNVTIYGDQGYKVLEFTVIVNDVLGTRLYVEVFFS